MVGIRDEHNGSVIVSILFATILLTTLVYGLITLAASNLSRARGRILLLQTQYTAETGADVAIATLNSGNLTYTGSGGEVTTLTTGTYKSTFNVTVANGASANERIITSVGKLYSPVNTIQPRFTRSIEVVAQLSSTQYASGLASRNIIYIESGVKTIKARDIIANGFIALNKNTTQLIAENITVGGKDTTAANCSIEGYGILTKPATFSTAGQTKTNITTAYNNCITPPGNTSDANFTVAANQSNVPKIQSTYIPWSQFMDSTYQNSPTGCADWTTGSTPRSIPSTGNTKKTHYPDNGSGISATCGTSGDIDLGSNQYNIVDNAHVRANFCAATACNPIFNNPSATVRYLFIEGSANFASLQTAAGSGPIIMIIYGTDPASLAAVCPYGGATHLSNSGTTSAPAIYLLSLNGLCIDKTKFGSAPALGGLSGKNIYIASNPGTPFDLGLDPAFPNNAVPINLTWRAARYRRL
ncbi:MAG: hypothetical protein NVS1B7_0080 [Candidatus Saccharimonadales bacterium]